MQRTRNWLLSFPSEFRARSKDTKCFLIPIILPETLAFGAAEVGDRFRLGSRDRPVIVEFLDAGGSLCVEFFHPVSQGPGALQDKPARLLPAESDGPLLQDGV